MIISSKVPANFHGFTLLEYLSQRFSYLTKDEWQQRITEQKITCNKHPVECSTLINKGDLITYDMPSFKEPPANFNYSIIYEDQWLLGINKPPNLLVHHSGKSFTSNLIYQLRYKHHPQYPNVDIINRLDRETSGVVLVARNKTTLREMNKMLAQGNITKEYTALVHGIPKSPKGTITLPIGKEQATKISFRHCVYGTKAKSATTHYQIIQIINQELTLLHLRPITGRTHQIRVHCKAIGHSIVGDKLYNMNDDEFIHWQKTGIINQEKVIFSRQALHCHGCTFLHPHLKQIISIQAPLAHDIASFISERHN